ncbi:MAG: hypothetical protein IJ968_00925 [Clostridia bacterium]|nr:hypothetical protein [Clostridia bacterium]
MANDIDGFLAQEKPVFQRVFGFLIRLATAFYFIELAQLNEVLGYMHFLKGFACNQVFPCSFIFGVFSLFVYYLAGKNAADCKKQKQKKEQLQKKLLSVGSA